MHLLGRKKVISRNRKLLIKGLESQTGLPESQGQQNGKGLVWFNTGALLTGGTRSWVHWEPEWRAAESSAQGRGHRRTKEMAVLPVSVHSEGKVVYTYLIKLQN